MEVFGKCGFFKIGRVGAGCGRGNARGWRRMEYESKREGFIPRNGTFCGGFSIKSITEHATC
jgi:hypothetical protein